MSLGLRFIPLAGLDGIWTAPSAVCRCPRHAVARRCCVATSAPNARRRSATQGAYGLFFLAGFFLNLAAILPASFLIGAAMRFKTGFFAGGSGVKVTAA